MNTYIVNGPNAPSYVWQMQKLKTRSIRLHPVKMKGWVKFFRP